MGKPMRMCGLHLCLPVSTAAHSPDAAASGSGLFRVHTQPGSHDITSEPTLDFAIMHSCPCASIHASLQQLNVHML